MSDPVLETQKIEESDETPNTADALEVNKARKKAARKRADRLKFIQAAMQHEEGRAWFYDILLFCKVFQNSFEEDPYRTYFNIGQRNVGLNILADIQDAAPNEYLKMINENKRVKE